MSPRNADPRTTLLAPEIMEWDTEFFGVRTARAEHLDGLNEWVQENEVELVYLLLEATDTETLHKAEDQGFRVMDTRVTLCRPTAPKISLARMARAEDTSRLRDISRHAFHHTRFYSDRLLPLNTTARMYAEWTRSACAGAADVVLVIERDDVPVGYVTVHLDPARIGLIAVADDYRGLGIGAELVNAAIDFAHIHEGGQIEVSTQVANIGALRTFESCGFRVCSSHYWLHLWL